MARELITFTLNGRAVQAEAGRTLLSYLRDIAHLTAAKNACSEGTCGACSVIVDGAALTSCTIPLERVAGKSITTVEGIPAGELAVYVEAFSAAGAVQCGFCTPGMILSAKALLDRNPDPTDDDIRRALAGNLCRCTGYAKIFEAITAYARASRPRPKRAKKR